MSHAYKKVCIAPVPFSFVRAVTERGDLWWLRAPSASRDVVTTDLHEFSLMSLMERGALPRVEA